MLHIVFAHILLQIYGPVSRFIAMLFLCFLLVQVIQISEAVDSNDVLVSNLSSSPARADPTSCDVHGSTACSLGYYCSNGTCHCRKTPRGVIHCQENGLNNLAVLNCYSATFDARKNIMEVGACAWNCGQASNIGNVSEVVGLYHHFTNVPSDYDMCKPINRIGTLCGRCLPDHYPLAYSFSLTCAKCNHIRWNWVRYIMAAYLPLTLFYSIVIFFKINVVSSHLHPVALFSQGVSLPALARSLLYAVSVLRPSTLTTVKVGLSLYGIWNLDFFRPFYSDLCLGIGILPTLALDYVIAVYPLLLMIISYLLIVLYDRNYRVITILWRPFRILFSFFRRNWDIRTSVIDAFVAFFFLSNVKFLSVSFDLIVPTRVYHLYGDTYNYTYALYYSADIEYFGREHLPYGILAIVMLCVFVILPVIILALYPFTFFQKFLNQFPFRWYILHTFVDSFQGCYKDGTEPGTRDCRWFSAVFLAFRSICFFLYAVTLTGSYLALCSLFILLVVITVIAFQPYKNRFAIHFKTTTIFLAFYAMLYALMIAFQRANTAATDQGYINFLYVLALVLGIMPLFCVCGFLLYWLFSRCGCCPWLRRFHWWRRGYMAMGSDGDVEDTHCGRVVNPQAYVAANRLVNYSTASQ